MKELLGEEILGIVNNQIESNNPPQTKQALMRLRKDGYSDIDAKKLIGQCVIVELQMVITEGKPFDEERFVKNLERLPKEPIA
jgi:hypothetical protein